MASEARSGTTYGIISSASYKASNSTNSAFGGYFYCTGQYAKGVWARGFGSRTSTSSALAGIYGSTNSTHGYAVYSLGDFTCTGSKAFTQPHPTDPSKSVQFVCLEGNENGTYFRGTGKIRGGSVEIDIPQEWKDVTAAKGITVRV